jgi:hypothetical protein
MVNALAERIGETLTAPPTMNDDSISLKVFSSKGNSKNNGSITAPPF